MLLCIYRFWSDDPHEQLVGQTRSSFYANRRLQRVFIGEQRGGVVWEAWHHANAALWRKCASPDQAEVRPVLWHTVSGLFFLVWSFRAQRANRLRGAQSAPRYRVWQAGSRLRTQLLFLLFTPELKSKFGFTLILERVRFHSAWNSGGHLELFEETILPSNRLWPPRHIHIWDCRKPPWISSATLT